MRILTSWGLCWGPPIYGNCHIPVTSSKGTHIIHINLDRDPAWYFPKVGTPIWTSIYCKPTYYRDPQKGTPQFWETTLNPRPRNPYNCAFPSVQFQEEVGLHSTCLRRSCQASCSKGSTQRHNFHRLLMQDVGDKRGWSVGFAVLRVCKYLGLRVWSAVGQELGKFRLST